MALCQAVQSCGLSTECTSIPRRCDYLRSARGSRAFEEFRAYHESTYRTFSKIAEELADSSLNSYLKYDLIHIISSSSARELGSLCSEWLSQLNPCGVALISGLEKLEGNDINSTANIWRGQYIARIVEMHSKLVILSKRPVGLIRLLLQSSDEEFAEAVKLFRTLGDRIRLSVAIEQTADVLQVKGSEPEYLRSGAQGLRTRYESLEEEYVVLNRQRDCLKAREVDAEIRHGNKDIRLAIAWAEKEDLRKRMACEGEVGAATEEAAQSQDGATVHKSSKDIGAHRILLEMYQYYCRSDPRTPATGRQFWDACGHGILSSVVGNRRRLHFRSSSSKKISVIVVLRNKAHLSVLALCSLLRDFHTDYELVLVDNASSDETPRLLSLIDCTRIIRNDANRGFGPAVMQALPWVSGELVCLLNNDALLEPGTIGTMIDLFSERPALGAAGGKILLADGRLQEAGCIVWRDGRTHQYGREHDPQMPQYNFRRPVDYGSGAFLVTPRSLFTEVGGLDQRYGAGYYEDVDYCAKVWEAGRSVIYEPGAVLHHYEGASSSNQVAALQLVLRNHEHFTSRWKSTLQWHEIEGAENVLKARVAAVPGMVRFLYIVDSWGIPFLERELAKLRQESDRSSYTCMYTEPALLQQPPRHRYTDVEQLRLDTMSRADLEAYFKASDKIVMAARESSIAQVGSLLENNAAKLSRISVELPN